VCGVGRDQASHHQAKFGNVAKNVPHLRFTLLQPAWVSESALIIEIRFGGIEPQSP